MSKVVFNPKKHIVNIKNVDRVRLLNNRKEVLEGIWGWAGVWENEDLHGHEMGIDFITMSPGSAFPLHVHPGAHILLIETGPVGVRVDGILYELDTDDTVFVPADYPHGVTTLEDNPKDVSFWAFGYPHMPIDSDTRMTVVDDVDS